MFFLCLFFLNGHCTNWSLVWSDEFDSSTLNSSKWNIDTGSDWYNEELQTYVRQNIEIKNGILYITAKKLEKEVFLANQAISLESLLKEKRKDSKKDYFTSGRINSKASWLFGRFEAKMKIPTGKGIWSAFWLYPKYPDPFIYKEIDIFETIGSINDTIYSACWYSGNVKSPLVKAGEFKLDDHYESDFHIYAVEWKKNKVDYFFDGKKFFTCNNTEGEVFSWNLNIAKKKIIINVAIGGNWPGPPDETTNFPRVLEVDYVKVYEDLNSDEDVDDYKKDWDIDY